MPAGCAYRAQSGLRRVPAVRTRIRTPRTSADLCCATRPQVHPLSGPTAHPVRLRYNGLNHYEQMVLHVPGAPAPAPRVDAAVPRPAPAPPKEARVRKGKQPYTPPKVAKKAPKAAAKVRHHRP